MIARVADHCCWLGRYVERVESTARVLEVTGALALDGEIPPEVCWPPVVVVAGQEEDFVARFGREALADAEQVAGYLALDADNPVSLRRSIAAARENARSIREVISLDVWQVLNELHVHAATSEFAASFATDRDAFFVRVRRATQLVLGLCGATMLHDAALDFLWLGVFLERVGQTARLLDVHRHGRLPEGKAHPVLETALWVSLLRACSGFEPFVKTHQGRVSGEAVANFLLHEPRFPHSVRFSVEAARARLSAIRDGGARVGEDAFARLSRLADGLDVPLGPEALDDGGLHARLTHVVAEIHAVAEEIGRDVLGHDAVPPPPAPPGQ